MAPRNLPNPTGLGRAYGAGLATPPYKARQGGGFPISIIARYGRLVKPNADISVIYHAREGRQGAGVLLRALP